TCISYIKDGLPFNPYKAKQPETAVTAAPPEQPETPQVLTMGGKSPQNLMYDGYNDNAMSNQGGKVN
ncbi:zonular occludens toxin family protein, partial [Neisseria sp. P0001.S004]